MRGDAERGAAAAAVVNLGLLQFDDTIAAISTPPGRGGVGVVRLSGKRAREVAAAVLAIPPSAQWKPWSSFLARLLDESGETVDHVVVSFFAAPRSYTAEDVVEISCHGAPVVLEYALRRCCQQGARLAEPGEFTLRAFLNGRIDLPRAEAVRDLIEATTLYQARVAARQMEGSVSRRLSPIKDKLLELISLLEAGIDFAEDDVDVASDEEILRRLKHIVDAASALASTFSFGRLVHSGFTLAIVGRPNVGKSSLFNRLLQQDRAIVTDIPGTTRDTISEAASLEGIPVRLLDTAGIRQGQDIVESLGIERSFQAMADADLTLVVLDASCSLSDDDRQLLNRAAAQGLHLVVFNKCDLARRIEPLPGALAVSALTGEGIDRLRHAIRDAIGAGGEIAQQSGFITNLRHAQLLEESLEALGRAQQAVHNRLPHEMLLVDLYSALRPIDAITGATTADDILNRIFSTFCIGK